MPAHAPLALVPVLVCGCGLGSVLFGLGPTGTGGMQVLDADPPTA